jgi:quinoprotein relay system zinc metallohydrolase 2
MRGGRTLHRALVAVGVALVASRAANPAAGADAKLATFAVENPAPGVYVHYGRQEEMSRDNAGDISNAGFVVGRRCVAVIDTGGTYAVGRALRDAIRRITPLPICYVINTHVHPDHVFGNAAFVDDHPQFVGHARLAEAMRRRGPNYLHALERDLGDVAHGSVIVLPTHAIADAETIDLGERPLTLRAWKTAHTDNDLTIFDATTRTLWLGDLAFVGHIPVVDGSLRGFVAVIDEIKTIAAARVIPGHGRALAWPASLAPEERYLRALLTDVRNAIKAGRTLPEAVASVKPAPGDWLLSDAFHKRNVSAAYAELEWER